MNDLREYLVSNNLLIDGASDDQFYLEALTKDIASDKLITDMVRIAKMKDHRLTLLEFINEFTTLKILTYVNT